MQDLIGWEVDKEVEYLDRKETSQLALLIAILLLPFQLFDLFWRGIIKVEFGGVLHYKSRIQPHYPNTYYILHPIRTSIRL